MQTKTMLAFRKVLKAESITFCYSGFMTEALLMGIGNTIKKQMQFSALGKRKSKSVFSVFVEQMQSVLRFSAERIKKEDQSELSYGVLAIGESGYKVSVACGHIIHAADAARFKQGLDQIKRMDSAELKAYWKDSLRREYDGECCELSADISFINIARRSKGFFEYDFVKISDNWVFFTIKAFL